MIIGAKRKTEKFGVIIVNACLAFILTRHSVHTMHMHASFYVRGYLS